MKSPQSRNDLTLYPPRGRISLSRSHGKGNAVWQESSTGSLILDPTSGLLVTAMRLWQDGRRNWHLVSREFRSLMGSEKGGWALEHFESMMAAILNHANRELSISNPGQAALSPDELLILRALAAVQRDEFDIFATAMQGLFDPMHRAEPAVDMMALARLMGRCGVTIGNVPAETGDYLAMPDLVAAE
ncbi:hypothetical protein DFP90_10821 [Aestuariispira insulae]|uniref:Uncharacterized protein n=2 Tax=Aestuariispira insulae TaxID=1461337 RepID=A0A3D9HEV2_9PROT|nr:hypothetical protein DFP90_10821 [Aestuariispira insulae]